MTTYNTIGTTYNTTRKADPYIYSKLNALLTPQEGKKYLDIGCGTGNYTAMFANSGIDITGVDPSETMLEKARQHTCNTTWVKGFAEELPFADNSFSGALATFTVHHWADLNAGFAELKRVLQPGSKMVMLTFTPEQEAGYWLNHYFPAMMQKTINRTNNFIAILSAAIANDFRLLSKETYDVHEGLTDLFCYAGKHNPEMYFDPLVRAGISSFALWPEETDAGLNKLRADIDSGKFTEIKKEFDQNTGDYLFVVLES